MFRIGEFSKIAQVSGRLLRYYDEIDLFKPVHIDRETGYRYYSATQLPCLNRILALKELGLSLEQITRMLDDDISLDEMRGMLLMKKAQIEQTLREELQRFQQIESRLAQIESEGEMQHYEVIVKSIPAQRLLSIRQTCETVTCGMALLNDMMRILPAKTGHKALGHLVVVVHSEAFELENVDLEMGYLLVDDFDGAAQLSDGRRLAVRELPAVESMASTTCVGLDDAMYAAYAALGSWMERNGCRFAGTVRELFIQPPHPGKEHDTVIEIQIPVEQAGSLSL